jgi:hypothetical protein
MITGIFLLSSCATLKISNGMRDHEKYLEKLASSDFSEEEKLEYLAVDIIRVLEEALSYKKTKHTEQYLRTYIDRNEVSMDLIFNDFTLWYQSLSIPQKASFLNRQYKKPYIKEFRNLIPVFEKRMNQKIKKYTRIYRFFEILIPV